MNYVGHADGFGSKQNIFDVQLTKLFFFNRTGKTECQIEKMNIWSDSIPLKIVITHMQHPKGSSNNVVPSSQ